VQPGIEIDYATGDSWLSTDKDTANEDENNTTYVLNTNTKKFHYETCSSAMSISENNKDIYRGDRTNLIEDGYVPCGVCKP
jgi:DNA-entry nuclease